MKMFKLSLLFIAIALVAYFLIKPSSSTLNPFLKTDNRTLKTIVDSLEYDNISQKLLKENSGHQFYWHGQKYEKSPYALIYLHGFSASPEEGAPVHKNVAKRFGMNLYVPRMEGHGLDTEHALLDLSGEAYLESAKEALTVAKKMGEKVILMGSSTGCTLALYLAAHNPELMEGMILYSPNIALKDASAKILAMPFGLHIGRLVIGSEFVHNELKDEEKNIWYGKYRLEAVANLQKLLNHTMKSEIFQKVNCPTFIGYYYKNKDEQDPTVSVEAILEMHEQLGTTDDKKHLKVFPDAGSHVIASPVTSNSFEEVEKETIAFLENILGLNPIEKNQEN